MTLGASVELAVASNGNPSWGVYAFVALIVIAVVVISMQKLRN